jgi:hypothetical protein
LVLASLSSIVSQGNPLPNIVGLNWLLQQAEDPTSEFYHPPRHGPHRRGGHSEEGLATTMEGSDHHIITIAPIACASAMPSLHGPALFQCGGMDTTDPCSRVQPAFDAVNSFPVMLFQNNNATHGSGKRAAFPLAEPSRLEHLRSRLPDDGRRVEGEASQPANQHCGEERTT